MLGLGVGRACHPGADAQQSVGDVLGQRRAAERDQPGLHLAKRRHLTLAVPTAGEVRERTIPRTGIKLVIDEGRDPVAKMLGHAGRSAGAPPLLPAGTAPRRRPPLARPSSRFRREPGEAAD